MLRLVIADDEKPIVDLFEKLIDPKLAEIVGRAYNGLDALELIRTLHPDVVISDIYMPGLRGIDLALEAKKLFPDIAFIIVSGKQEFDDARDALNIGVTRYFLKPLNRRDINRALEKLNTDQSAFKEREVNTFAMQGKLDNMRVCARRESLANLFSHRNATEFVCNNERLQLFAQNGGKFLIVIAACCAGYQDGKALEKPEFLRHISENISTQAAPLAADMEHCTIAGKEVFLFEITGNVPEAEAKLYEMLKTAARKQNCRSGFPALYISIGTTVALRDLLESYEAAVAGLTYRICAKISNPIVYSTVPVEYKLTTEQFLSPALKDTIQDSFCAGNDAQLLELLNRYLASVTARDEYKPGMFRQVAELLEMMHDLVCAAAPDSAEVRPLEVNVGCIATLENLKTCLLEMAVAEMAAYRAAAEHSESAPVKRVLLYVQQHYAEKISLNELAGQLYLNPTHLGRLFQKQNGMNFSDYVTSVRISKAKAFLNGSAYNISEIAEKVGFADVQYFSKLFTKSVGVSPSQYRSFHK